MSEVLHGDRLASVATVVSQILSITFGVNISECFSSWCQVVSLIDNHAES